MKKEWFVWGLFILFSVGQNVIGSSHERLRLVIRPDQSGLQVVAPGDLEPPIAGSFYSRLTLESSDDLIHWNAVGDLPSNSSAEEVSQSYPLVGHQRFFRLQTEITFSPTEPTGTEVFGYGNAFSKRLADLGQISVEQFEQLFPPPTNYLPAINFDPTSAVFWKEFDTDPAQYNSSLPTNAQKRLYDFRLNDQERELFQKNGFVVSERLGAHSFAEIYYRIYTDDLPVFISTDAILQAWHRSYLAILDEIEEVFLANALETVLRQMHERTLSAFGDHGGGVLRTNILDADFFLTVARSLLNGSQIPSALRQDGKVLEALDAIRSEQLQEVDFFGKRRRTDFSQFKVRGHYEVSIFLQRYFRAMMWLGRMDFRIVDQPRSTDVRELGTALVLYQLLKDSGQFDLWKTIDKVIENFVGWADSMTFPQMGDLLDGAGVHLLGDIKTSDDLQRIRELLVAGTLGVQNIRGDYYASPLGSAKPKLPRSLTFFGQRFVPDSWVFSQVVYDSIIWDADGVPSRDDAIQRRVPSCLDMTFAALGNNQVVPEIAARIRNTQGQAFRDGLPYQHNLAAVRQVLDSQSSEAWESNIYMNWLACLRELSEPTTDAKFPQAMRTRAWAMKTLNTQLASWTHLRHNTILYAKQSYTGDILCFYPAGFVEPLPEFWARMEKMARLSANLLQAIPTEPLSNIGSDRGVALIYDRSDPRGFPSPKSAISFSALLQRQIQFLNTFAERMRTLKSIAERELAQQPLSEQQAEFLQDLIESRNEGYYGDKRYSGWYPNLFYKNLFEDSKPWNQISDKWDALVADVHTDVPSSEVDDPGGVLHQAVGNVHLMLIVVDNGPDRMVYAGPVLSHYEFLTKGIVRKTDTEWKQDIVKGEVPPHPEWTRDYLVPGNLTIPASMISAP